MMQQAMAANGDGPTSAQKMRSLKWVMSGQLSTAIYAYLAIGGPVFMLFLSKLGLDKSQIGVVISVVPFIAVLSLFFAPVAAAIGYKRTFVTGWLIRTLLMASVILMPLIVDRFGTDAAFGYLVAVLAVSAIFRTAAFSGLNPWMYEMILPEIRGKYSALSNMFGVIASSVTVAAAGVYLGEQPELESFIVLFIIAAFIGLTVPIFYSRVPAGRPASAGGERFNTAAMLEVVKDGKFVRFIAGGALVTFGWVGVNPAGFLALYLSESLGLHAKDVAIVSSVVLGTGLFTSFLWGWAADRYGSKPIIMICLSIMAIFPLLLALLPPDWDGAYSAVLVLGALIGLALPGWAIGYSRYLMINLIPEDRSAGYSAVNMAATGLVGGLAPIMVGLVLSLSTGFERTIDWLVVDSYTPLFVGSFLLLVGALLVIATMPSDARVTTAQFAGMFISGQPLAAMQAMYSHSRGGPEEKRLLAVRRLGRARSPLAVDELLEAMEDPSITVRGQALISIASSKPDARLTDALLEMVETGSMEMSTAAAWAVGQLHDPRVIEVMLQQLDSPFPMMRGRAAISLARQEHRESAPRLLELFHKDELLAPIYGECLGVLRYREAIKPILDCLENVDDEIHRRSLAYAVAMILGQDNVFLLLLRRMRKNLEGARDEFHYLVRTRMPKIAGDPDHAVRLIDDAFAAARTGDRDTAAELLNIAVAEIDPDRLTEDAWLVINESLPRFQAGGPAAREFGMLVLHAMLVGEK